MLIENPTIKLKVSKLNVSLCFGLKLINFTIKQYSGVTLISKWSLFTVTVIPYFAINEKKEEIVKFRFFELELKMILTEKFFAKSSNWQCVSLAVWSASRITGLAVYWVRSWGWPWNFWNFTFNFFKNWLDLNNNALSTFE